MAVAGYKNVWLCFEVFNQLECASTFDPDFYGVVGFLELINNMLTLGMVPALYNDEEKEQVIGQVILISSAF